MNGNFEETIESVISAIESGDYKKAADGAARCIELEPANPEGHFYLGESLAGLERPKEAIKA
jgi:Flp pilus assembly protein TadD